MRPTSPNQTADSTLNSTTTAQSSALTTDTPMTDAAPTATTTTAPTSTVGATDRELAAKYHHDADPDQVCCPITATGDIIRYPVVDHEGTVCELQSLAGWFQTNRNKKSALTNSIVTHLTYPVKLKDTLDRVYGADEKTYVSNFTRHPDYDPTPYTVFLQSLFPNFNGPKKRAPSPTASSPALSTTTASASTQSSSTSFFSTSTNNSTQTAAPVADRFEPLSDQIRQQTRATLPANVTVEHFRQYVHEGKEAHAAIVYENNDLNWLIERGRIEDKAGRIFENASGFEYTIWALDKFMRKRILSIARTKLATLPAEQAHAFCAKLIEQYSHVKTVGLTYSLPARGFINTVLSRRVSKTEPHYDHAPHINAMQTYVDNLVTWSVERRRNHWCNIVGGENGTQVLFVQNFIQEHLRHDRSFDRCPNFHEGFIDSRGVDHRNDLDRDNLDWHSGLRSGGGYIRGRAASTHRVRGHGWSSDARWSPLDLAANVALYNERLQDFNNIERELLSLQAEFAPAPALVARAT